MTRRHRTITVVTLAVLLATAASYGVYRAISRIPVREVPIATRYAVVARDPLPIGTLLRAEQVKLVPWPESSPLATGFTSIDEVVGRGLISSVVANEPITTSKLAAREAGGGLPPLIPPGMRAMSVKVNDVIGVAGFTQPGTRVDVVVTVKPIDHDRESVSRVVVSNVQVLTAGARIDQDKAKDGKSAPSNVVTLLVTPRDSERIALAQNEGQINLTLRNPLDVETVQTTGVRLSGLLASPDAAPVRRVAAAPRPKLVAAVEPVPAPVVVAPAPYAIEAIRGAKRTEEVIKQ